MLKNIYLRKLNNTRETKLYISDKAANTATGAERETAINRG